MIGTMLVLPAVWAAGPNLIPTSRKMTMDEGRFTLPQRLRIAADASLAESVERYSWILDEVAAAQGGRVLEVAAETGATAIVVREDRTDGQTEERYSLQVSPRGVVVRAAGPGGVFNAFATLAQMIEQATGEPPAVPACRVEDFPALAMRVVHIDMTCQQYLPEYICRLMRKLAGYKINAILMEYSDMFPFRRHRGICRPDAWTEEDVAEIRRTAEACHQEIIPFLQCLGHLQYVLHKPGYEQYGRDHRRYMLCPSSPEAMPLVRELIDEILAQHPGIRRLHVGGDEVDTGRGGECPRCQEYARQHGFSSLYVHHYTQIADYCRSKGVTPLMWSDMILQHPEAITEMPRNVGWVVWDYYIRSDPAPRLSHGAAMGNLDRLSPAYRQYFGKGIRIDEAAKRSGFEPFGHALGFTALGFEAFTAPAARCSGDHFDLPRLDLHMSNVQIAFRKAVEFKLPGAILTSWSYRGSPHEVCLPEYACAAAGWNANVDEPAEFLRRFLSQRYGIDDADLAEAIWRIAPIVPPSMLARPELDDARGAWIVPARGQLQQLRDAIRDGVADRLSQWEAWRQQASEASESLRRSADAATRNRQELRYWQLSLEHLVHRLGLIQPLARLLAAREGQPDARHDEIASLKAEVHSFEESRDDLRSAWAELYGPLLTSRHLEVDLYNRFDAEKKMIEAVLPR